MQSVLLTTTANRFVNNSNQARIASPAASLPTAPRDTVTLRFGAVGDRHPVTPGLVKIDDGRYTGTITHHGKQYTIQPRAILSGAILSKADLSKADLSEADLSEADLSGASFWNADFWDAKLSKANLSEAILSGANLSEADLSKAELTCAKLTCAYLSGADLTSTQNIPSSILNTSILRDSPAFYDVSQPLPTLQEGLTFARLASHRIMPAHDADHARTVYMIFEHLMFAEDKSPQAAFKALADQEDLGWTEQEKETLRQMAEASQPQ